MKNVERILGASLVVCWPSTLIGLVMFMFFHAFFKETVLPNLLLGMGIYCILLVGIRSHMEARNLKKAVVQELVPADTASVAEDEA